MNTRALFIKVSVGAFLCLLAIVVFIFSQKPELFQALQLQWETRNWNRYENKELGISFKYPVQANGTELHVFVIRNFVFVTTPSSLLNQKRDVLQAESELTMLNEAKELSELDTYPSNKTWVIWVRDANSDTDLQNFIDDRFSNIFGDGCKVGEKFETLKNDTYDVNIISRRIPADADDYPSYSCWINWMMAFKYSPTNQRAAMWDIGQEGQFFLNSPPSSGERAIDSMMARTFNFIPQK